MTLLKQKKPIKYVGCLIKLRYNDVSINEELLELPSMYFIVVVQSWKITKLKMTNGIKNVYKRIRSTVKLLKSKYVTVQIIIIFTGNTPK